MSLWLYHWMVLTKMAPCKLEISLAKMKHSSTSIIRTFVNIGIISIIVIINSISIIIIINIVGITVIINIIIVFAIIIAVML